MSKPYLDITDFEHQNTFTCKKSGKISLKGMWSKKRPKSKVQRLKSRKDNIDRILRPL